MQAILLDLAGQSPFSLDTVRVVECADPYDLELSYSARRDVIRGIVVPPALVSRNRRIQRLVNDVLGGDQ